ncbi:MAG: GNAT family N-acetyltransferase, partial [Caulobacterales bacterium]
AGAAMKGLRIRPAGIEEASALTALANRAKASWGYDAAFMAAAAVRIEPADIAEGWVWVAKDRRGRSVGVASLRRTGQPEVIDLDNLFVEPRAQGEGVGEALLAHTAQMARALGAKRLRIEADPNAAPFYERMGARLVGEAQGTLGRPLPVYELAL